ncbi:MAG: hypothetical protein AVDCRST_MAG59-4798, partial [uncultured Thermomicrobiales bacterium]
VAQGSNHRHVGGQGCRLPHRSRGHRRHRPRCGIDRVRRQRRPFEARPEEHRDQADHAHWQRGLRRCTFGQELRRGTGAGPPGGTGTAADGRQHQHPGGQPQRRHGGRQKRLLVRRQLVLHEPVPRRRGVQPRRRHLRRVRVVQLRGPRGERGAGQRRPPIDDGRELPRRVVRGSMEGQDQQERPGRRLERGRALRQPV